MGRNQKGERNQQGKVRENEKRTRRNNRGNKSIIKSTTT